MTYHPQNGCGYGHVTVLKFSCSLGLSAIAELLVNFGLHHCNHISGMSEVSRHCQDPSRFGCVRCAIAVYWSIQIKTNDVRGMWYADLR